MQGSWSRTWRKRQPGDLRQHQNGPTWSYHVLQDPIGIWSAGPILPSAGCHFTSQSPGTTPSGECSDGTSFVFFFIFPVSLEAHNISWTCIAQTGRKDIVPICHYPSAWSKWYTRHHNLQGTTGPLAGSKSNYEAPGTCEDVAWCKASRGSKWF